MTTLGVSAGALPSDAGRRWTWTIVGVALALVAIGLWARTIVRTQFSDSYATLPVHQRTFAGPVRSVDVSVQDGTVVIERASTSKTIVETSGTRAVRTPTDQERLAGRTLHITSTCGTDTVSANYCRRNYVVRVPNDAAVVAAVGTGNLEVAGIAGSVQATVATGPIVLSHTAGKVQATTDTGDIIVAHARGALSLHAGDGSVSVLAASTRVAMTSDTGGVTASDLTSTTVSATATDGSVALAFVGLPERVVATTQTGDVTVILPPGAPSYNLDLTTRTGAVMSAITSDPTSARTIRATAASGDIDVSAGGSPSVPVRPLHPVVPSSPAT